MMLLMVIITLVCTLIGVGAMWLVTSEAVARATSEEFLAIVVMSLVSVVFLISTGICVGSIRHDYNEFEQKVQAYESKKVTN